MMLSKRLRSRGAVLAAVGAVVALSAGLATGLGFITQTAVADGAASIVAAARGDDAVVRVAIRWAGQSAASDTEAARAADDQSAAVRDALERLMPAAGLAPRTSIRSEPLRGAPTEGRSGDARLVLLSDATLLDRVTVVEGTWPSSPDGAALDAAAAEALGIGVGDIIDLPSVDDHPVAVTVSALWRALDPGDAAWAGDPLVVNGVDGSAAGPLVIDETVWRALDTRPIAQWIAALDPARATPAALDQLAAGLPVLAASIGDDPRSRGTGIVVDGGLASTVAEVRAAAAGVEAIIPTVLALIAVAAVTTLLQLQRMLGAVRRDEMTLLRSRGASSRRLAGAAAVEALIVSLPSALVGAAVGAAVGLAARPGSVDRLSTESATALAGAVGALVVPLATAAIAAVITARAARAALRRDTLADSGRTTRAVSATALVLGALAAVVAGNQFLLYRGAVVPTADGGSSVDAVAALAPVLALVTGALLTVMLVEPLARLAARSAAKRDGLLPVLVARPLARSAMLVTAPVLVMTLAVGGLVVTAAVDSTTRSASTAARELALGAPLTVSGAALRGDALATLDASAGALTLAGRDWSAAPVTITPVAVADLEATLVALDRSTLESIVLPAGGAVDAERLGAAIATDPVPALDIPAGAVRIRLADESVRADYWVADARGGVTRVTADDDGAAALRGAGPWRLLALDVQPVGPVDSADAAGGTELDIVLTDLIVTVADGSTARIPIDGSWQPRPEVIDRFGGEVRPRTDARSGFIATVVRPDPGAVRVMPDPITVRFAVTPVVAEQFAADVGDRITVRVPSSSRRVEGELAAIVPAIPGAVTVAAVAVDLVASVQRQLAETPNPPTASAVWIAPAERATVELSVLRDAADELREIAPRGSTVAAAADTRSGALADGVRALLWTAAVGALLLAIATVATVSRAVAGTREVDVVVLRAIGAGRRAQGRARALELGGMLVIAVAAGITIGAAVSSVLVGDLARSLLVDSPAALTVVVRVDPAIAVAVLVTLTLVVAALALDAGRRAARMVGSLSAREVLR